MSSDLQQAPDVRDSDWLEFESALGELAQLAKSGAPFERLAQSLLEQSVHILAAVGGAVWMIKGSGGLRLECQLNFGAILDGAGHSDHQQLLEAARSAKGILVVPPGGERSGPDSIPNPTGFTLLVGPLAIDEDVVGFIELIQRPSISAAAGRGNQRLLGLVCELASEHLRRQVIRELRDDRQQTRQFDEFTVRIHSTLDLRMVAYELVNSARQFIDCDRVSVTVRRGRRQELLAISSVDTVNRSSNAARALERVAASVASTDEAIWYVDGNDEKIAPQVLAPLRQFADDTGPRIVGLIPLHAARREDDRARRPVLGVLIIENFNSDFDDSRRERASRVAQQGELALVNALRYEALPTFPLARRWNDPVGRNTLRRSAVAVALAGVALVASLRLVPMEFNVYAEGELQPQLQQHVFAPLDGQVVAVRVKHGDHVAAAQELVALRSPDIDLERQRIQGEYDVTQRRIASIESSLLQVDTADDPDITRFSQLAAEQEELAQLLASQREQLALLREETEKLVVRSPVAGEVLTWEMEQSLADRPVQRGQLLTTIANLDGPWVAELAVPDDEIGYLVKARDKGVPLRATFQLATSRGTEYEGEISRIAGRTETGDDGRPIVRLRVDVDEVAIGELRPGATIFAHIHCGERSAAFVLFHRLFERVERWFQF